MVQPAPAPSIAIPADKPTEPTVSAIPQEQPYSIAATDEKGQRYNVLSTDIKEEAGMLDFIEQNRKVSYTAPDGSQHTGYIKSSIVAIPDTRQNTSTGKEASIQEIYDCFNNLPDGNDKLVLASYLEGLAESERIKNALSDNPYDIEGKLISPSSNGGWNNDQKEEETLKKIEQTDSITETVSDYVDSHKTPEMSARVSAAYNAGKTNALSQDTRVIGALVNLDPKNGIISISTRKA
jgi:hypothetical protein